MQTLCCSIESLEESAELTMELLFFTTILLLFFSFEEWWELDLRSIDCAVLIPGFREFRGTDPISQKNETCFANSSQVNFQILI